MPAKSMSVIGNPEFINLTPLEINPLMSKCEIKVFYLGQNRNHSYITKEVGAEMAKTLRGAPIVGYYKEDEKDFADHGEQVVFDGDGVHFNCLTVPYGFVDPAAQVWWQKFNEEDEFGNTVEREYLMTTGYLWTGQFEEAKLALETRPQSMELDGETMEGHWSEDANSHIEFFIIDDATFSKLCILGENVEPCFEGSTVSQPQVSTSFTKDTKSIQNTLFTMMQDLQYALQEGGEQVDKSTVQEETIIEEPEIEVDVEDTTGENFEKDKDKNEKDNKDENQEDIDDNSEDQDDNDDDKKYALLEQKYQELEVKYLELSQEYQSLVDFKAQVESKEKDDLINQFYMLSEEDKKDVIENKDKYSLEEIESKLSVICVRKKVSFDKEDAEAPQNQQPLTYSFDNNNLNDVPAWVAAVQKTQRNRENIGG